MAGTTDPRAAGFDADVVREALTFAMNMGLPESESERVSFRFLANNTYSQPDVTGLPYDFSAPPEPPTATDTDVQVPVAMEFVSRVSQARDTSLGRIQPSRVELYVLDTHIDQVRGAQEVIIDENTYRITSWGPPIGLFDLTVYMCQAEAIDES